jgi:hypothetical protein
VVPNAAIALRRNRRSCRRFLLNVLPDSRAPCDNGLPSTPSDVAGRDIEPACDSRPAACVYDVRASLGCNRKTSQTTAASGSVALEKATTVRPVSSSTAAMNFARVAI